MVASGLPVDDVVLLLKELVGFPTESLTPNRALIDWLADYLHAFGARVELIEGPTGRANLLASLGPIAPGGLLLSAHTDVVPAGPGWQTGAYELTRFDHPEFGEALRARGTADMKGFIACALVALRELDLKALRRPVHLAFSYDEEIGCVGVRGLLDHLASEVLGPNGSGNVVAPELVVIGEPSMMRPRHAHLGKVAYRLTFQATPGHSSLSPFLPSAIGGASRSIAALESIAEAHRASALRDANGEASADVTVNVGTIHGGTALNVLSERCELTFELRHTTAFDPDGLLAPFWAVVDSEGERTGIPVESIEIVRYPALSTDTSNDMVRLVERIADRGRSIPIGYGTEGGLFAAALGAPVVVCGPGDIAVAHKADEYVSVDQLRDCLAFLRQLIPDVCTV
jgi:acetylornithine deacetylase